MSWRSWIAFAALSIAIGILFTAPVGAVTATETTNKGLYISPLRSYLTLNAGDSVTRAFTVANLTEETMTVRFHVEEFSVTDYAYDYRFNTVDNDWVQLVELSASLKPYESREVPYRVSLPKNAAPGGQYYTLYASSTVPNGTTTNTVQVATLLYLTVDGTLKRTSEVSHRSLPFVIIDPAIAYTLDIKNTGNTHYFAHISAQLEGLFYRNAPSGTSQLLMPGTTRNVDASIASPLLPGIYKLTSTATPDQGAATLAAHYFLYLPIWFIILLILATAFLVHTIKKRRITRRQTPTSAS